MSTKAVIILSGGLDSTVLLYKLLSEGREVHAIGFNYGQRHSKELNAAAFICRHVNVPFSLMDLHGFAQLIPGSSQTDKTVAVPEGHYEEESMKLTVVPNRNMVMLSIAAAHALALGVEEVYYGAHGGDHAVYPDCRPEFVEAVNAAFALCDWKKVKAIAPYLEAGMTKVEIAKLGQTLKVPMQDTWTCYKGGLLHCGKCGSCQERREAFQKAGVPDLTAYEEA